MEKFCCVSAIQRTFANTKEDAANHGRQLLEKQYLRSAKPGRMLIVQVVGVVEIGFPEVKVREPTEADFFLSGVGDEGDDGLLPDEDFNANHARKTGRRT